MSRSIHPCLLLLLFLLFSAKTASPLIIPNFTDVTSAAGLPSRPLFKYGGPIVADLDDDGRYDLILTYHQSAIPQVFYGSANGTFTEKKNFIKDTFLDVHGVAVAPRTTRSSEKIIVFSLGGGGGKSPRLPLVLSARRDRTLTDVTEQYGFGNKTLAGRGCIALFMDLSLESRKERRMNVGGPDLLIANFRKERDPKQIAYKNINGRYGVRPVPGFEDENQGRADLTDIDGDGVMEIISFQEFRIYKLINPFEFEEVADQLAPGIKISKFSVNAVVEFDMDNDGDFDLYLARGFEKLISNNFPRNTEFKDILLENRNGRYFDVSSKANLPGRTRSMGVSAGDFNNDGFIDLIVTQLKEPDILLLNKGNGRFKRVNRKIMNRMLPEKSKGIRGDNTLAVDYDLDGRVDLITGQGSASFSKWNYFLLKNVMNFTEHNHFLLVKVGNDPNLHCTALHAVVTASIGSTKMVRRVSGRGSQKAGPGSYLDTVHFGLGSETVVDVVSVRWTTGAVRQKKTVRADRKILIGSF